MSTRATYLISWESNHMQCFYVHHDNYLAGAANYFFKMHQNKNFSSSYAGRFFRANECAEFTESHEIHSDTQYRYNLDEKGQLIVLARGDDKNTWKKIYNRPWYEFVNQYLKGGECLYLFKLMGSLSGSVMTLSESLEFVKERREKCTQAYMQGTFENANSYATEASYVYEQINTIIKLLEEHEKK